MLIMITVNMTWMMLIMITATTTTWMRMTMILQDGDAPVALRVVAGRVEERDADHRHRRSDRQRRNPPGNY